MSSDDSDIMGDWECRGCGRETVGARPDRCVKCGSGQFVRPSVDRGQGFRQIALTVRRLARDAASVAAKVRAMHHRRHLAIGREMAKVEWHANKAVAILTGTVEPVRPGAAAAENVVDPEGNSKAG